MLNFCFKDFSWQWDDAVLVFGPDAVSQPAMLSTAQPLAAHRINEENTREMGQVGRVAIMAALGSPAP